MHNILSEKHKKVKYLHYGEDCPLKNSPICNSKQKTDGELENLRGKFNNDSIEHANKSKIVQKRARQTLVTGRHNEPGYKLKNNNNINNFYSNQLKSEIKKQNKPFVNDAIASNYRQTSIGGRYMNGEHNWRVSVNDPLMPRYEPLNDAWIKNYFKKPVVKKLMRKTMPAVKCN